MKTLFDAFISYGRADSKAFATNLHKRLLEEGFKVWFDQNDIPLGVDFQNQIDDGIEQSHNFLFIIAPHSVKSPYCLKEIELAVKRHKRIIPLLHVEPNDCWDKMHPTIGKINWVYFREEQDNFDQSFAGLVSLIRKHADYVEQHTRFLVKALAWERNQKQTRYLLIGEERVQAESWLKVRFKNEQPPCIPTDLHCEYICESTKNANNLLTQVFLAYSDKDRAVLEKIGKSLMREGFTIWTNRTDIRTGTQFQTEIDRGIEGADNVIYLISPDSIQSKYCQDELTHALAHKKRIIPLLIEPTNLEEIPLQIQGLQFIDFTQYSDEESYHISVDKLLNQLKQDAYYYEQHKVLLVKALKWFRQNRNPSILLRGYNLQHAEAWLKVARQRQEHPPLPLHEEFIGESLSQPTDSSVEVFISYSRADSDFARKLNEALQIQGKTTWFDQESIASGTDFQQEIYRGIENSDNFLFIISPRSVNSPYCSDEVEYAQKLNKRFVTVLHRDVEPIELHPALAKVQWIDFNRHDGDLYANFSELVRTLDTDREHVRYHTKWS
ncbi:MAG TPA: toll/interleukin-1 receptor domain-containing protein, partial [Allocoleopsis sp.]